MIQLIFRAIHATVRQGVQSTVPVLLGDNQINIRSDMTGSWPALDEHRRDSRMVEALDCPVKTIRIKLRSIADLGQHVRELRRIGMCEQTFDSVQAPEGQRITDLRLCRQRRSLPP